MHLDLDSLGFQVFDGHEHAGIEIHVELAGAVAHLEGQQQREIYHILGMSHKQGAVHGLFMYLLGGGGNKLNRGSHFFYRLGLGGHGAGHRDAQHLAGGQFAGLEVVVVHDLLGRHVIAAGNVFQVFVPADGMLLVLALGLLRGLLDLRLGRLGLLGRLGGGFLTVGDGDQQDAVFSETGLAQVGVSLVEGFLRYVVGLGNAEQGLTLHHQVGVV